jgi:hypothetical protein
MNVETFQIDRSEAVKKVQEYRQLTKKQRRAEDDAMEALYRSVLRDGTRILELNQCFRQTGLNERGEPRLAIARADWQTVHFFRTVYDWKTTGYSYGFSDERFFNTQATAKNIFLPRDVFNLNKLTQGGLFSPVPHIPPGMRPKFDLKNYHILFEVEKWEQYPVDPFLLRRIPGTTLFIVIAEWELTKLEASLLSAFTIK